MKDGRRADVESVYPLSPMQQGMLFHSLYEREAGIYIDQMVCTLHERVVPSALERALDRVAERHAILRTAFRWSNLDEPQQEVRAGITIPFQQQSFQGVPPGEVECQLEAFLDADRRRGFDLAEAPLTRATLLVLGEAEHILIWTFHHALLDGRSFPVIVNEIFAFYEAFAEGRDRTPPSPRPYRDYIAWLKTLDHGAARTFFRETLKGFTAPTPLPGERPSRAAEMEVARGERRIQLSTGVTAALSALAERQKLTRNTLVQGAWALLLSRYSGETDIVFGATRACRRSALGGEGTDTMVGVFINTLPLRVEVVPGMELTSWLEDLRARWSALRDHEHTPLVNIREWSDLPPGAPLFQTLLVFEDYLLDARLRAQGGAFQSRSFRLVEQTNYPLTLAGYGGASLTLRIDYDRRRFDDAAIERMLGQLEILLEAFTRDPKQRLADLPILTEAERRELLVTWNDTAVEYPRDASVHALFEAQARRTPDVVAVVFGDRELTYRELDRRANQLARALEKQGVGVETPVGLCAERSLEMVVALLGILKAGGAYVPIDADYPAERREWMLRDAGVHVVVTAGPKALAISFGEAKELRLDAGWGELANERDDGASRGVTGEGLAYIMYTSGSAGRPKGTCIPHRAIARLVKGARYASFTPDEVFLQLASISFDAATFEIWGPLLNGGKLVVPSPGRLSLTEIGEVIRDKGVTTLWLTTGLFNVMIESNPEALKPLRRLLTGGDALSVPHVKRALSLLEGVEIINAYGPTESTTFASSFPITTADGVGSIPIGRPIASTTMYILDDRMAPAPIGAPGEIYIGGDGLARAYLNQPALTAEKFVPNPFSAAPLARLYRTGDRARFLPDGNIEFLGRIDQQVKIRGFRVELGEIEAVLSGAPSVDACVAVVREDTPGDKRIVAYFVTRGDAPATVELRSFLQRRLPEFMVPSAFVKLERLPLTANGKVDRRALPPPGGAELQASGRAAPRGREQDVLALLFARVLSIPVERVGAGDSFFELGGNSLLALRLLSELDKTFGEQINLATIFDAPTVERLAKALREAHGANPLTVITPPTCGTLPLFWCGQARSEVVLLGKHLGPDQPLYHLESSFYRVEKPATHVKDFASRYVREILAVQSKGPYLLGGFCIDGFVAFEIAVELEARGHEVALLVMVERDGPDPLYACYQKIARPIRYHLKNLERIAPADHAAYIVERLRRVKEWIAARVVGRALEERYDGGSDVGYAVELSRMGRKARDSYVPARPYAGKLVAFFCDETNRDLPVTIFPNVGWDKAVRGEVEIQVVPGDHESIVHDPSAQLLAKKLRACLDAVHRRRPAAHP